jgi:hypothetical protein
MKFLILISAVALLCVAAQDDKKEDIKVYKRLIPADILRGTYCNEYFARTEKVRKCGIKQTRVASFGLKSSRNSNSEIVKRR